MVHKKVRSDTDVSKLIKFRYKKMKALTFLH